MNDSISAPKHGTIGDVLAATVQVPGDMLTPTYQRILDAATAALVERERRITEDLITYAHEQGASDEAVADHLEYLGLAMPVPEVLEPETAEVTVGSETETVDLASLVDEVKRIGNRLDEALAGAARRGIVL